MGLSSVKIYLMQVSTLEGDGNNCFAPDMA